MKSSPASLRHPASPSLSRHQKNQKGGEAAVASPFGRYNHRSRKKPKTPKPGIPAGGTPARKSKSTPWIIGAVALVAVALCCMFYFIGSEPETEELTAKTRRFSRKKP